MIRNARQLNGEERHYRLFASNAATTSWKQLTWRSAFFFREA